MTYRPWCWIAVATSVGLVVACNRRPVPDTAAVCDPQLEPECRATPNPTAQALGSSATPSTTSGERSRWAHEGSVIKVNNRLCGLSRSPISDDVVGKFESRVVYTGAKRELQGKTFVFNQCCEGCVAGFPEVWSKQQDEILAFHGVALY